MNERSIYAEQRGRGKWNGMDWWSLWEGALRMEEPKDGGAIHIYQRALLKSVIQTFIGETGVLPRLLSTFIKTD